MTIKFLNFLTLLILPLSASRHSSSGPLSFIINHSGNHDMHPHVTQLPQHLECPAHALEKAVFVEERALEPSLPQSPAPG